ncbi:MAG: hypothetical protein ACLTTP_08195 [Alistipes ihumii]
MVALDGKRYDDRIAAIQALQAVASRYAVGRDMHVGDTIIGIKGRVGFEAAAPMVIIKAHHMLEKHTLTKWQLSGRTRFRPSTAIICTKDSITIRSCATWRPCSRAASGPSAATCTSICTPTAS